MKIKASKYTHRTLLRFVIEADGPLAVGSGEKNILTDACVALDVNGLPYIPGTSIAGVLRHAMPENKELWGYQEKDKGHGSEIIISEAKVINSNGAVVDGIGYNENDDVLKAYKMLPIRQHVRINERGTTDKGGKFDNQVVLAGSRFCFEIEILSDKEEKSLADQIVTAVSSKSFRLGSGTRNGYGQIKVIEYYVKALDLTEDEERKLYLAKSSRLDNKEWWGEPDKTDTPSTEEGATVYKLELTPRDFFLFGSGMNDFENDADMAPVLEKKIEWTDSRGNVADKLTLIPATSVKGALRHRTTYHYNKLIGNYADKKKDDADTEEAIGKLFGNNGDKLSRGNLLFSDVYLKNAKGKLMNHVSIDRFTGGAIDGALFSEYVSYAKDKFTLEIVLTTEPGKEKLEEALELALKDICKGMLPLGGGVNRGNGMFNGKLFKDGKEIEL